MIKVKLINRPTISPLALAEHAAKTCYQAEMPELKGEIDQRTVDFVRERLFKTGHHTTLQHWYVTFAIEDIAISDVTFGLHLASPFYNSDQRSGRFCGKMFTDPDYDWIEKYVRFFWPELDEQKLQMILQYVKIGVGIYQSKISEATELARRFMAEERPHLSAKNLDLNAPKIAQEQLRMFIPTILPTALDFTINLTGLVAMWQEAWTPVMRFVTDEMKDRVLEEYPELGFMFDEGRRTKQDWSPEFITNKNEFRFKSVVELRSVSCGDNFSRPAPEQMQPVDTLHFSPWLMENGINEVVSRVEISMATMGQDQRHRTVRRGLPRFTGSFYCPPVVAELFQESDRKLFGLWAEDLKGLLSATLHTAITPYGAMVEYSKIASFDALLHEQAKRSCWCAQEEAYHMSTYLRSQLIERLGVNHPLIAFLAPPCFATGKCVEGDRYCGRHIQARIDGDYFPDRKI